MRYRDLIPGRLNGRFIASHIRIPEGGPVPDYPHYHHVRFQMIFCRRGWVRVVYEDQGEPFVMTAGDCVLQPPTIRHRVLEASPGLEVVEIGCPAEHATCRDHDIALPTGRDAPSRLFGGQRFVRHQADSAAWGTTPDGFAVRDTGIAAATDGLAGAQVLRADDRARPLALTHAGEFRFLYVLEGEVRIDGDGFGSHLLAADDSCTVPAATEATLHASADAEVLDVRLPAAVP